jgi:hypothetical protein
MTRLARTIVKGAKTASDLAMKATSTGPDPIGIQQYRPAREPLLGNP